jgi:hypothetical protein
MPTSPRKRGEANRRPPYPSGRQREREAAAGRNRASAEQIERSENGGDDQHNEDRQPEFEPETAARRRRDGFGARRRLNRRLEPLRLGDPIRRRQTALDGGPRLVPAGTAGGAAEGTSAGPRQRLRVDAIAGSAARAGDDQCGGSALAVRSQRLVPNRCVNRTTKIKMLAMRFSQRMGTIRWHRTTRPRPWPHRAGPVGADDDRRRRTSYRSSSCV